MYLGHNPADLKAALLALIAAAPETPAAARVLWRMAEAAADPSCSRAVACARSARAAANPLAGLAATFRNAAGRVASRPCLIEVADAFELAADHLDALAAPDPIEDESVMDAPGA